VNHISKEFRHQLPQKAANKALARPFREIAAIMAIFLHIHSIVHTLYQIIHENAIGVVDWSVRKPERG
jgi:hypothetical protein